MKAVPELSRQEIEEQLDRLYQSERKRHLVAFFGTGAEDVVDSRHGGRFQVVPVESELDLRARMPALAEEDARIAFLVPWATEIPLDLAGRFARNGKVMR